MWDDNADWLIPVWLFNLLPDGIKLFCPIDSTYETKSEDTEDDYRMGCVAWSFA